MGRKRFANADVGVWQGAEWQLARMLSRYSWRRPILLQYHDLRWALLHQRIQDNAEVCFGQNRCVNTFMRRAALLEACAFLRRSYLLQSLLIDTWAAPADRDTFRSNGCGRRIPDH